MPADQEGKVQAVEDSQVLLAVFAHPDDEVFGCGGTIARYASQGATAYIVCATSGEVGEISHPALATPETLGQVRQEELRQACRVLGAQEPIFLGFRDSGMAGTADNADPRSLHQATPELVLERLVLLLRQLHPHVLVTWDEGGGYGHPDHVAIHRHTKTAFWAAGRVDAFPQHFQQGLAPHRPRKLYYPARPRSHWQDLLREAKARGIQPPRFLRRPGRLGTPNAEVAAAIDVSSFARQKREAMAAHRTQQNPNNLFNRFPEDLLLRLLSTEYFQRAYPPAPPGEREDDLFHDIR